MTEQRELRPELDLGVGGARPGAGSLKCLHAHVAFALARPGLRARRPVVAELEPLWPAGLLHALTDSSAPWHS